MNNYANCNTCIYKDKIVINDWGFYICPISGIMLEDLSNPISCMMYTKRDLKLSKKEEELYNRLKSYKFNITLQSLRKEDQGIVGKLKSKGLINIYSSWIKTTNQNYKKIKMIEVVKDGV